MHYLFHRPSRTVLAACVTCATVGLLVVSSMADRQQIKPRPAQLRFDPHYPTGELPVQPGTPVATPPELEPLKDVEDDAESVRLDDEDSINLLVYFDPALQRTSLERHRVKEFAVQTGAQVRHEYKVTMPNEVNLPDVTREEMQKIRHMPGVIKVEEDVYHPDLVKLDEAIPVVRALQG